MSKPDPYEERNISHFPSRSPEADAEPIVCLVILPFEMKPNSFYEKTLLPALRQLLEASPYFWRVVSSHEGSPYDNPQRNITEWMQYAKAYFIDISEQYPDTFVELGRVCENQRQKGESTVIIVLEKESDNKGNKQLSARDEFMRIVYRSGRGLHAIEDLAELLRGKLVGKRDIDELNSTRQAHYLSPTILTAEAQVPEKHARILSIKYETMEKFIHATPQSIVLQIPNLSLDMAKEWQRAIDRFLKHLQNL